MAKVQDLALGLVELHNSDLSPANPACPDPSEGLSYSQADWHSPPSLVSSVILLRVHSILSFGSLIKILNRTGPKRRQSLSLWCQPLSPGQGTMSWQRPDSACYSKLHLCLATKTSVWACLRWQKRTGNSNLRQDWDDIYLDAHTHYSWWLHFWKNNKKQKIIFVKNQDAEPALITDKTGTAASERSGVAQCPEASSQGQV